MIYQLETREGEKKSIYLFSLRYQIEVERLKKFLDHSNKDVTTSNKNDVSSSNTTEDHKECSNKPISHETNELPDKGVSQAECTTDSKHENKSSSTEVLKDDLESTVEEKENDRECDVKCDVIEHEIESTEPDTWDDYDCFKIALEDFFPIKVMDLDTQKIIITRFLNFYVGGRIPKGLRASDLLFSVISIIPLTSDTEEFIWHEKEYRDDGTLFFITPEDKLNSEYKAIEKKANKICRNALKDNSSEVIESNSATNKFNDNKNNRSEPPCNNGEILKNEEDNNISTSDNPNDKLKTSSSDISDDVDDILSFVTDIIENMSIKWRGSTTMFLSPCETSSKQYGPIENSAFISSCNKLLISWEESSEFRIVIKCFFGVIALTLMRGIGKGKKNIINTFKSKKFLDKIKFINTYLNYIPPQESCVDKCCKEMMLRERHHKVMLAKIIFNSIRIDIMQRKYAISQYYGLYNVFRMCVVDHIAYYDMGILNLLKSIYAHVGPGTEFSIILSDLKAQEIEVCMEQVRNFMLKYMKKEDCWTYHWARYFDSTQFEYLSCSKSYATAVVLAVFVEKMLRRSDVWRSGRVRKQEDDLDKYKLLAEELYQQYKCLCEKKCTLQQQFFATKE